MKVLEIFKASSNAIAPAVASLGDGDYVLSWRGGQGSFANNLYAQRYNINNTKIGNTLWINPGVPNNNKVAITGLKDKGFAISWSDADGSFWKGNIYARYFDSNNTASNIILVDNNKTGIQLNPSIYGFKSGGFIVTWLDFQSFSHHSSNIYAKKYGETTNSTSEKFIVHTSNKLIIQDKAPIAELDDNSYIIICCNYETHIKRYDKGNKLVSDNFLGSSYIFPLLTSVSSSKYVLFWMQYNATTDKVSDCLSYTFHSQIYSSNGVKIGNEIVYQPNLYVIDFSIANFGSKGFITAWSGSKCLTSDTINNAYVQIHHLDSNQVELISLINPNVVVGGYNPVICSPKNGVVVTAWQSGGVRSAAGITANNGEVYIQQFVENNLPFLSSSTGDGYFSSTGGNTGGSTGTYYDESSSTGIHSISSGLESYYLDDMAVLVTLAGSILYQTFNTDFFDN